MHVTDWKKFWNDYPACVAEEDFLRQVCHTAGGVGYSSQVFDAMVDSIARGLALGEQNCLLDICCGNGVVTRRLAAHCKRTFGIDFSTTLIEIARRHQSADNIDYMLLDALRLEEYDLPMRFDRICMYGALQHFEEVQIDRILRGMLRQATDDIVILIGAVPDAERKELFFDTPAKLGQHLRYLKEGRDRMGTWWHRQTLTSAASRAGLVCSFDGESKDRPGAEYRFDLRLTF